MPPRKKVRTSVTTRNTRHQRTTTPSTVQADTEDADASPKPDSSSQPNTSPIMAVAQPDPWTDDEETQLFKSIIQFKPTGVSAHLHMLSIQESLRSHGYTFGEHTRIPGIWEKLNSLYDLEALNEREDAEDGWDDDSSVEEDSDEKEEDDGERGKYSEPISFQESLSKVQDDFFTDLTRPGFVKSIGDMMWERRFTDTKEREVLLQEIEEADDDRKDGDVAMLDVDADVDDWKIPLSSPEAVDDLYTTRSGFGLTLPSREGADAAFAASVAEAEEDEDEEEEEEAEKVTTTTTRKGGRGRGKASSSVRGRTRLTRATPVQDTDNDEEEVDSEEEEENDDDDESVAADSPPAKGSRGSVRGKNTKGRGRGRRK